MPRKPDFKRCWYEAQRLANHDGGGDAWVEWELFPYNHEAGGPVRTKTRAAAIRAAKDCIKKHGYPVRVVHVEQVFLDRVDDDAD